MTRKYIQIRLSVDERLVKYFKLHAKKEGMTLSQFIIHGAQMECCLKKSFLESIAIVSDAAILKYCKEIAKEPAAA